jgi:hypothetical protein
MKLREKNFFVRIKRRKKSKKVNLSIRWKWFLIPHLNQERKEKFETKVEPIQNLRNSLEKAVFHSGVKFNQK